MHTSTCHAKECVCGFLNGVKKTHQVGGQQKLYKNNNIAKSHQLLSTFVSLCIKLLQFLNFLAELARRAWPARLTTMVLSPEFS